MAFVTAVVQRLRAGGSSKVVASANTEINIPSSSCLHRFSLIISRGVNPMGKRLYLEEEEEVEE
jgi:hypothetical protein